MFMMQPGNSCTVCSTSLDSKKSFF